MEKIMEKINYYCTIKGAFIRRKNGTTPKKMASVIKCPYKLVFYYNWKN